MILRLYCVAYTVQKHFRYMCDVGWLIGPFFTVHDRSKGARVSWDGVSEDFNKPTRSGRLNRVKKDIQAFMFYDSVWRVSLKDLKMMDSGYKKLLWASVWRHKSLSRSFSSGFFSSFDMSLTVSCNFSFIQVLNIFSLPLLELITFIRAGSI